MTRLIPCPGHHGNPCPHEFDYEQLLKRVQIKPIIECPASLEDMSVTSLLFGLHWSTQDAVLSRLDELEAAEAERHEEVLSAIAQLRELTQREFTKAFRREQATIESYCPHVFVMRPREAGGWWRRLVGQTFDLQLFCQAPGCWHPTVEGGLYPIEEPAKWIRVTTPYLKRLVSVLKYAAPLIGPWLGVAIPAAYEQHFKHDIKLMEELVKKLPDDLKGDPDLELAETIGATVDAEQAEGAALRALRVLLDTKDSQWICRKF